MDARLEAYRSRPDVVVHTRPASDVDPSPLVTLAHPGLAVVLATFVTDGTQHIVERRVAGEPLEASSPYCDKVLAVGVEVLPALAALHAAGLAHGAITRAAIVRCDDGLVLSGALASGSAIEDLHALVRMLLSMLALGAPDNIRAALTALAEATTLTSTELRARLVHLRAAIPLPAGRPQLRSIERLTFAPPPTPEKRSRRYGLRIMLIVALVGFALYAIFGSFPAHEPDVVVNVPRVKDGVVFIRTTPLDAGPAREVSP